MEAVEGDLDDLYKPNSCLYCCKCHFCSHEDGWCAMDHEVTQGKDIVTAAAARYSDTGGYYLVAPFHLLQEFPRGALRFHI